MKKLSFEEMAAVQGGKFWGWGKHKGGCWFHILWIPVFKGDNLDCDCGPKLAIDQSSNYLETGLS